MHVTSPLTFPSVSGWCCKNFSYTTILNLDHVDQSCSAGTGSWKTGDHNIWWYWIDTIIPVYHFWEIDRLMKVKGLGVGEDISLPAFHHVIPRGLITGGPDDTLDIMLTQSTKTWGMSHSQCYSWWMGPFQVCLYNSFTCHWSSQFCSHHFEVHFRRPSVKDRHPNYG